MGQKGRSPGRIRALFAFAARRERDFWFAVLAVAAFVQWPMLEGVYYRVTGAKGPVSHIEWRTDLDAAFPQS
jgi:hypothetical protein